MLSFTISPRTQPNSWAICCYSVATGSAEYLPTHYRHQRGAVTAAKSMQAYSDRHGQGLIYTAVPSSQVCASPMLPQF